MNERLLKETLHSMRNGYGSLSHLQFSHQTMPLRLRLSLQPLWKSCKETNQSDYILNSTEISLGN
jgi:hypothetical protein